MLTDVSFIRYEEKPLFTEFSRREARLIHQCFTMLEELFPYWNVEKDEKKKATSFWDRVHLKIANELGQRYLSDPWYKVEIGAGEFRRTESRKRASIEMCRNWLGQTKTEGMLTDEFVKERLSLVEVGLRELYIEIEGFRRRELEGEPFLKMLTPYYEAKVQKHEKAAVELNCRFQSGRFPLNYHNGFIQIQDDQLISSEVEQPFWSRVSEPLWENVDIDMKEALDQRDSGAKDPAFYAARALESTIKIISAELGQTHGRENGAHAYLDNILKKDVKFIMHWEAEFLKMYFTKVRNPLGHGAGKEPMPSLTEEQTNWAIENAMSWIKLLVSRHEKAVRSS